MRSDWELVAAWREGDTGAADELMRRYIDGVGRFFRSKCNGGVEDLMQRTFLACAKRRDTLRNPASFRSFLFGVAARELAEHYRRQGKQMARFDGDEHSAYDLDPSPSMLVAQKQERRVLLEALRRIPLNAQIAIELHYWEKLKTHEIADALGVPEGTVKSRLRRARDQLKVEIGELETAGAPLETTLTELGDWALSVQHKRSG